MYMTGNEVAKFVEKGPYVYRVSFFFFICNPGVAEYM